MLTSTDLQALRLTLVLALTSTTVLLVLSTPLAWWLARTQWRFKGILEALVALPLVLPPTVLGFYLLIFLGSNGPIAAIGGPILTFTFPGLVVGSVVYSLPFVVQPLQDAFASIDPRLLDASATLRAGPVDRFFSIVLPLSRPGFITAAVLGFAHTIGEFGVVLMLGGNIPGKTQVAAITIYNHVEALNYSQAHLLSAALVGISFFLLVIVYGANRRLRGFKV